MDPTLVVARFPALSETFILEQISGLIDRRQDVRIVSLWESQSSENETIHSTIKNYQLLDRLQTVGYPFNRLQRGINLSGNLLAHLATHPAHFSNLTRLVGNLPFHSWLQAMYSAKFFETHTTDLYHAHFGQNGLILSALKRANIIDAPLITTFYGSDVTVFPNRFGHDSYRILFDEADLILAECDYFRERLVSLGCPENKIKVHRIGVDPDAFDYQFTPYSDDQELKLLSVGRFIECKGFRYALQAVARINDEVENLTYCLIGNGRQHSELKKLSREFGIDDSVKFVGEKSRDEVLRHMGNAHLLLAPSITTESGRQDSTMMVLVEAMATGLPVIASKLPAIPEIIDDGRSGLLAEEKNSSDIAENILAFVNGMDDRERHSMANEARKVIEERFDINFWNNKLQDHYGQVTNSDG